MNFEIGKITKAQGIRGEVRVFPTTDDPGRFELLVGEEVFLGKTTCKVTAARLQKNVVIVKFAEINDRNTAETMVGQIISIPAEKALPLEEGEYYIRDLIGLNAETEDGESVGILSDVLHTGANDVYVIKPPSGDAFMIPAIKEVILNVNIADKKITLRLMEGLRELTV